MSSLLVTIPVSFLLSLALLLLVIHAVKSGSFDDWDGPAERHLYDDDETPEVDAVHFELPEQRREKGGDLDQALADEGESVRSHPGPTVATEGKASS